VRSTTRFREDIRATQEGRKLNDLFTHKYEALNPARFSIEDADILHASFKSSYATLLYILMRKSRATDFYETSVEVGHILGDNNAWEFHHIFPDAIFDGKRQQIRDRIEEAEENGSEADVKKLFDELNQLNDTINSIPNLAFLTPATNQSIGGREPSDYLGEILSRPRGEQILNHQLIPTDPSLFKLGKFEEFRNKRTSLILQKVNEYLRNENLI
jgi:hypothetical protein